MAGYTLTELKGFAVVDMIAPEDRDRVLANIRDGKVSNLEHGLIRKDGRLIIVEARGRPCTRGREGHRLTVIRDVTERKWQEDELRSAAQRKDQFIAMLGHELRNPLAPIRNSLHILAHVAPGGEQARRAMAVIDRQVAHLTSLVEDLLEVTRVTRGRIELRRERLELNELAQRTVEDHRSLFTNEGVRLDFCAAPARVWVSGDPTRLAQVIGNILQNAAKFTPRGGQTTLTVGSDGSRGQAILTVSDTGCGFSPEALPHLFDAFVQADRSLDRGKGGLGLGLAVVKGLVELHGGTVSGESSGIDKGATFTVRLPQDTAAGDVPREAAPARNPRANARDGFTDS